MGIEETFVMLKPDGVPHFTEIYNRLLDANLSLAESYQARPSKDIIDRHYDEVFQSIKKRGVEDDTQSEMEKVIEGIIKYMTENVVMPMIWYGENALLTARNLGGTEMVPADNPEGTIRRDLGNDSLEEANRHKRAIYNLIHTSDSELSAIIEKNIWFPNRSTVQRHGKYHLSERIIRNGGATNKVY